jgi:hypothetical protein
MQLLEKTMPSSLGPLCDGWRKMLIKQHLAPTVTKRSSEDLRMAEAPKGQFPTLVRAQSDIQCNQGVPAVIFSDFSLLVAHQPIMDQIARILRGLTHCQPGHSGLGGDARKAIMQMYVIRHDGARGRRNRL